MAFPESFVEEVRRAADIVRVIEAQVPLRKMGGSWKGLCPFHQEKTPSFNVRGEHFHCFGCGEGGDVFKFVMLHEKLSFPEAVESLAHRFGVPIPESRFEAGPDRKERDEILALMEAAAEHFRTTLWTAPGTRAREYLLGRGFKKETLERIRAGAAREGWTSLLDALKPRFAPALLMKAGLILEKEGTGRHYDRFRDRAVFPIANEAGKVVAFGARSLDGSEPKYLNSPETPVYQKSRVLYGLSWAKDAVRKEGRIVLMEGYLDVARALECGVEEAVATCGTALTPGHARLLRRFVDRVVVNFDQDAAGQKAAEKSFEALAPEGLRVQVVSLPAGHDPDSFLKSSGADAYRARLQEASEFMAWRIEGAAAAHETRTPPGKAAFLTALLPSLGRVENAVERAAWVARIAERGGLDVRATEQQVRHALGTRTAITTVSLAAPPPRVELIPAEKLLLARILRGEEGVEDALRELPEAQIDGLRSAEALRAARALVLEGVKVTAAAVAARVIGEDVKRLLNALAVEDSPASGQGPLECVLELRHMALKRRLKEIQDGIAAGSGAQEDVLLIEKMKVKHEIAVLFQSAPES